MIAQRIVLVIVESASLFRYYPLEPFIHGDIRTDLSAKRVYCAHYDRIPRPFICHPRHRQPGTPASITEIQPLTSFDLLQSAPLSGIAYCLIIIQFGLGNVLKKSRQLSTYQIPSNTRRPADVGVDTVPMDRIAVSVHRYVHTDSVIGTEDVDDKVSRIA